MQEEDIIGGIMQEEDTIEVRDDGGGGHCRREG